MMINDDQMLFDFFSFDSIARPKTIIIVVVDMILVDILVPLLMVIIISLVLSLAQLETLVRASVGRNGASYASGLAVSPGLGICGEFQDVPRTLWDGEFRRLDRSSQGLPNDSCGHFGTPFRSHT